MITIEAKAEGMEALIRKARRLDRRVRKGLEEETDRQAEIFRREVIQRASGRPGPNIVTGEYVSRFRIVKERIWGGFRTSVVNDHPASRRLELGYTGVDSLGRTYNQPPFPHWRIAAEVVSPQFARRVHRRVPDWWGRR